MKFWQGADSNTQNLLPRNFIFSSDFGHFIFKNPKFKMLIRDKKILKYKNFWEPSTVDFSTRGRPLPLDAHAHG